MGKILNVLTLGIRYIVVGYRYYKICAELLPIIENAIIKSEHLKGNKALINALNIIKKHMNNVKNFEKHKDWIIDTINDIVATSKRINVK